MTESSKLALARQVALRFRCPVCLAAPRYPCTKDSALARATHGERLQLARLQIAKAKRDS